MQRLTTRTGTGMWVPVPADPLTSPGPANAILPLSHNRSIRGLPPARIPANAAASLASASLLDLGLLPKADNGWREAHGLHFWFTRDYSATLPSQWAQQVLGHNLLLGLSSHIDTALSYCMLIPSLLAISNVPIFKPMPLFIASSAPPTL
jgi:hypothetical protein